MRRSQDLDVRQQSSLAVSARRSLVEVLVIVGSILGLDQLTKQWILRTLEPGPCSLDGACIDIFWTLRLNLIFNPGASFSTGRGLGPLIGAISFVMAAAMIFLAARSISALQRRIFASIAGGALGNGFDRLFRAEEGFLSGEVVDFIDFQWWPVFNVADIAIVCAVVLAIVVSFVAPDALSGETNVEAEIEAEAGS